jgi:hypothetical protein
MSGFRLPGPLCRVLGALEIDSGTMCRSASPIPGPVCGAKIKGKAVLPAKPVGEAHVLKDPETHIGNVTYANAKRNHECVVFAQQAGGAPFTGKWGQGTHVEPGTSITRGTWVATFVDGQYQGHIGAFDSIDADGNLTLIDQFNSRGSVDRTTYHVKKQPYNGKISNDPSEYYVVLW